MTCKFEQCGSATHAKGMCVGHYKQVRRGEPMREIRRSLTTADRFWEKVSKSKRCWEWTGGKDTRGYGQFGVGKLTRRSHRIAYELVRGPVPDGMMLDHMCHNRSCVNPYHLRPVTGKQNLENLSGLYSNNTSGARGVSWNRRSQKWEASVRHNGRRVYLGKFKNLAEANSAVTAKRNELFTHNDLDRQAGK